MRAAVFGVLVAGVMVYAPAQNARLVRPAASSQDCSQPGAKIDMVFIIDRSGSFDMNLVGQSYNVQIEGVLRALRDRSVIPRDGSVAVAVETFAGSATIQVPFKQIDTAADAEAIAAMVEGLRCTAADCTPTGSCPVFGFNPASNYAPAITTAGDYLNQNRRPGARQTLLLSSDGQPSDPCDALEAARRAGHGATSLGIQFELDLILLAVDPQQTNICEATGEPILQIVFPQPGSDLPGAVLAIGRGDSNKPCASLDDSAVKADHDRQVKEFAELTRRVLRSQPATRFLTVNTDADTDPDAPVIGSTLSLRQAIERANNNCGATTITFAPALKDKTIGPRVPLPALGAPDIRICGCDELNCGDFMDTEKKCPPFLTIDGTDTDTTKGEQHSDGILIRSNHDVVRGLRIINFKGAGVGIDPGMLIRVNHDGVRDPGDLPANVGFNLITRNVFENNVKAGVRVVDDATNAANQPIRSGLNTGDNIGHNIGNTILGNTILDSIGCATPIDLGGDGRTDNDLCDTDQGPNTLLNFPRIITVTQSAGSVTVKGSVCDPNCIAQVCPANLIGAVVEIFAIREFGTDCGGDHGDGVTDVQVDLDNRVITGVMPLATGTTDANGSFTISGVGVSPTCGYTATVTDLVGNTSELMFPCAGFARAEITPNVLEFPQAEPNGISRSRTFTIKNAGCDTLRLTPFSFKRASEVQLANDDDSLHFPITSPVVGSNGMTLEPGQIQVFTVRFDPAIPRRSSTVLPPASLTLPRNIKTTLTTRHEGCGDEEITITASVTSGVHLINPKHPERPPVVTLERAGDEFTATYSVFDSDRDVKKCAKFEFFDDAGNPVPLDNCCVDLTNIQNKYVAGQSFTIMQKFSNARNHPEATTIRVTACAKEVCDAEVSNKDCDTFTSGRVVNSNNTASAQSLHHRHMSTLILSSTEIAPVFRKTASRW